MREAEHELPRRPQPGILERPGTERGNLRRVVSEPVYEEGLRTDFKDGLLRVQGLVRILEDEVEASPKGPHLDAKQALRLPTSTEEDLRRRSRCGGGEDHAQKHCEGRRPPYPRRDCEGIWR